MSNPFSRLFGITEKNQQLSESFLEKTKSQTSDNVEITEEELKKIEDIPLQSIIPNPYQPREVFEEEKIRELANSIQTHGLIQPIVLRKQESTGLYEIVSGERRFRAVTLIGWDSIEAIVRGYDDKKSAAVALIENIQRENLTPVEEARAFQELMNFHGLTQEALAQRLGKGQSTIANKLRLLNLPLEVLDSLLKKEITERHGRALLSFKDDKEQLIYVFQQVITHNLNVKQTEDMISRILKQPEPKKRKKVKVVGKNVRLAVNELNRVFKTMEDFGYDYEKKEEETEDYFVVTIKIPKNIQE